MAVRVGFRSPKEQTPGPYYPTLTAKGHTLSFNTPKAAQRRVLFTAAPRFSQYAADSRRTGSQVGPGSYSPEQVREPIIGTPVCKAPAQLGNEGYFYVGEHLVRGPRIGRRGSLVLRSRDQPSCNLERLYQTIRRSSSPLAKKNALQRAQQAEKPPTRVRGKRRLSASVN